MNDELALYKEMLDKVKDIILLLDEDGRITYANNEALKLYGYTKSELLHMNISDLRSEDKLELLKQQFRAASKEAVEFTTVHFKKDHSQLPVAVKAVGIEVNHKKFIVSIIRDITDMISKEQQLKEKNQELTAFNQELIALNQELIENEEKLRANYIQLEEVSEKANKANLVKNQFLANMSHELRTPMNGILGIAELMGYTQLNTEQKQYIEILKSSSDHLLSIIDDLFGIANIESGKIVLNNAPFNLTTNIEMLVKRFSFMAENKDIEIMHAIDPLIDPKYIGDKIYFNQVLINLMNNAIKFTQSGYIFIELKKVDESKTTTELQISIEDTGTGIPVSYREDIFNMFTQGDTSSTKKFGGTGLGLTIAKNLAQLMGGDIYFESEEGKGSTFYFTLSLGKVGC